MGNVHTASVPTLPFPMGHLSDPRSHADSRSQIYGNGYVFRETFVVQLMKTAEWSPYRGEDDSLHSVVRFQELLTYKHSDTKRRRVSSAVEASRNPETAVSSVQSLVQQWLKWLSRRIFG